MTTPQHGDRARLRAATPDDAAAIARLQVTSWRASYSRLLPADLLASLSEADWAERRRSQIETPPTCEARNWVLEDESGLFGWASAGLARDEDAGDRVHELFALYLEPARIGSGHGRRLLDHCLADALARGYGQMILWMLVGNERADRFYARAGFCRDEATAPEPFRETGAFQERLVRELS